MREREKQSRTLSRIVIICSVIIAILSTYILLAYDLADKPVAGKGDEIGGSADIGGKFTLIDHNGDDFTDENLVGKISLVYFGFTFCPDICPTSLQKIGHVVATLDKYGIDVTPIFITVDPKRDSKELLKDYLHHFSPKLIGLTGNEHDIRRVADLYKVYYAVAGGHSEDDEKYMLDHSSFVYLMDRNGKYVKHFYMSSTPEEIIEYIRINHKEL